VISSFRFRKDERQWAPWMIPLAYAAAAVLAGIFFPRLENRFIPGFLSPMSAPAAIAIYSSIASGMIALTGIVFSLTFVMVQFSATAYSPRLVLWVARDPLLSHSLGVFTATFLYAIAAMAWVDRSGLGKVPFLSVFMVIFLLLASVAMFIGLIQSIGMLHLTRMLFFTGEQARKVVDKIYPQSIQRLHMVKQTTSVHCHTARSCFIKENQGLFRRSIWPV
jgi:uncharacterized membrane protein